MGDPDTGVITYPLGTLDGIESIWRATGGIDREARAGQDVPLTVTVHEPDTAGTPSKAGDDTVRTTETFTGLSSTIGPNFSLAISASVGFEH